MKKCLYDTAERERLAYRLLPQEEEQWLARGGDLVHWSRLRAGDKSAATLVLLHGAASNASRWEEFVENSSLRGCCDMIRLDARTHASSVSSRRASLEMWCADLEALLEKARVQRPVLVGHSLGAHVAMHFAASRPEKTAGLVLLDPLVSEALSPKALAMKRRRVLVAFLEKAARALNRLGVHRRLVRQDLRAMDRAAREKLAQGGRALEDFIRSYSSVWADLKYMHAACYLRDMLEAGRASPAPQAIQAPVLAIAASGGTYTDADLMRRWAASLPEGTLQTVHCAHWPLTECPQEVDRVVAKWIRERFVLLAAD